VRAQALEQRRGGGAGQRETGGALEELAPVQGAVDILVEQVEQLRVEVFGLLALHLGTISRPIGRLAARREKVRSSDGSIWTLS